MPVPSEVFDILTSFKSELRNRRKFEREMEERLGAEWNKQRRELMRLLGDPPDINKVPESYWNNGGKGIRKAIAAVLEDIYLVQSFALIEQVNLQVDWMLVNQHAIDWAARWGMQKATELTGRTRNMVIDLVTKYYQQDWDIDELTRRIAVFYAPERARSVAITETTNAAVQSQIQLADDIRKIYGVDFEETYRVGEYDRVCAICAPLDGKPTREVGYPPRHVNCACYVEYTML